MKQKLLFGLCILFVLFLIPYSYALSYENNIIEDFTINSISNDTFNMTGHSCLLNPQNYSYSTNYLNDSQFCISETGYLNKTCEMFGKVNSIYGLMGKCYYKNVGFSSKVRSPIFMFNKTYNRVVNDFKNITIDCNLKDFSDAGYNDVFLNIGINNNPIVIELGAISGSNFSSMCNLVRINYRNVYNDVGGQLSSCEQIGSLASEIQYIKKHDLNLCYKQTTGLNLSETFTLDYINVKWISNLVFEENLLYDFKLQSLEFYANSTNISSNFTPILSNSLPLYNITYLNQIQCLSNESQTNTFNIIIDSFDLDNDTILYSTQQTQVKNLGENVKFNKKSCFLFFCNDVIDSQFLDNVVYNGNCEINLNNNANISKHNLLFIDNKYKFGYNGLCSGIGKSLIYKLDKPLINVFYATKLEQLQANGETFNLTFYDEFLTTEIMKIKVNVSGTQQYFYSYNGTDYNFLGNRSYLNPLEFSISQYGNGTQNTLILLNEQGNPNDLIFDIDTLSLNIPVRYIVLEVGKGLQSTTIYQDYFSYNGLQIVLEWSLNKPETYTLNGFGIQEYLLFVTDSFHVNDTYNVTRLYFTNNNDALCQETNINSNDEIYGGRFGNDACNMQSDNDSLWSSILLLLRLPFLMLCIGNLNYMAGYVGVFILVGSMAFLIFRMQVTTFKQYIMYAFALSLLLLLMNLFPISLFLLITLIFGFTIANGIINGE